MERRNTIQKKLILKTVQEQKRHLTAEEVHKYIQKDYPTVGKGTVYRNLHILAEEGLIRRVEVPDGPDRFDFTVKKHFHVRCIRCGAVSDVDMAEIPDWKERIRRTNGVEFLDYDIFFKGICPFCNEKEKEGEDESESNV